VTPVDTIKNSVFKTSKGGVIVNEFLEVSDFSGVFAIGDCCYALNPKTQKPYPPTAQNAEAQAKIAAHNLHALIKNGQKKKLEYSSKGQMAVIGKKSGIATIFGINLHGFLAWWVWRTIYLSKIPRLEKRIRILLDWTVDLFFDRDIARLKILRRDIPKDYRELDEVDDVW
jgi:NADH dehydrogenase